MKVILTIFLLSVTFSAFAQVTINQNLKKELREIDIKDQNLRKIFSIKKIYESKSDSLRRVYKVDDVGVKAILAEKIKKSDSLNIIKIDSIIERFGYPGKSLVGESESYVAWEVIQHSVNPKKYVTLLKNAVDKNEIPFRLYALTFDRSLVYDKKPQIYGSQGKMVILKNNESQLIIWPIENPVTVNKLRKKAGFDESVKKYAKHLGIKYKVYTIDDIVTN